jgi:Zn-finger nucleic acid-binding protein
MKCPICTVDLHMTERSGVEIDYCPQCRGVWLDRGELDKIVAMSASGRPASGGRRYEDDDDYESRPREQRRRDYEDYEDDDRRGRGKRGGWLGELFEFGD